MGIFFMADRWLDVLEKYDFEVNGYSKSRGMIILNTDKGPRGLKEYRGNGKHVLWAAEILNKIEGKNNIFADSYILNNEEKYVTESADGNRYVLKKWFDGIRDCDIKKYGESIDAVKSLARLHNSLAEVEAPHDYDTIDYLEQMKRRNSEMLRIQKYMRGRNNKTRFELLAAACSHKFYEEGRKALDMLDSSMVLAKIPKYLCHADYNYHNICYAENGTVIVNFEKMCYGYQITDLYNFLRKIMEKNNWDIKLGYSILSEYDKIRTITDDEKELLAVLLIYPEKFWKLVNTYYNSNKAWFSEKNSEKLTGFLEQNQKRLEFINTLIYTE